jgi:hypothetical protein
VFLQNPNDLLFRETALAHRRSPRDRLNYQLEGIPGSRSARPSLAQWRPIA